MTLWHATPLQLAHPVHLLAVLLLLIPHPSSSSPTTPQGTCTGSSCSTSTSSGTAIPSLSWHEFAGENSSASSRERFVTVLGHAVRDTGFFRLLEHDVPGALIERVFAEADRFFALPTEEKDKLDIGLNGNNRGWARPGSERLDETREVMDKKEAFNVGLDLSPDDPRVLRGEPFRGVNVWPERKEFKEAMLEYYDAVLQLGVALHAAFEQDLGLPNGYLAQHFTEPTATLRMLHYPEGSQGVVAGEHTDYGSITLLLTDGVPGLQVKPRGGDWIDVPHVPGAFIVNIGDCLMRWTNDLYVSTPHRVLAPDRVRRSIAFFIDPNPDAPIVALPGTGEPKYEETTAGEYVLSRLAATYS